MACSDSPGKVAPVVDRGRCEGKSECAAVCPYGVFEVRRIKDRDFAALGLFAKLKVKMHGSKSAYTPHAEACHACGLCVAACPEKAIRLEPVF